MMARLVRFGGLRVLSELYFFFKENSIQTLTKDDNALNLSSSERVDFSFKLRKCLFALLGLLFHRCENHHNPRAHLFRRKDYIRRWYAQFDYAIVVE